MSKYNEELIKLEKADRIYCFHLDTGMKLPSFSKNVKQFFHPKNIKIRNKEFNFYYFSGIFLTFTLSPESFLIMIGVLFTYISTLTKKSKFDTIHIPLYGFRELSKYFLKIHIRNNLKKLHELYARELITNPETKENSEELQAIRKISTDIESYLKTLPSTSKFFASTTSIGFAVFGLIPIIGINLNVIDGITSFYENNQLLFIMIMIILYFSVFLLSFPFKYAFKIKRILLLNSNKYDYFNDYFPKTESKELYENSVYKIENDLYEAIKNKNLKPLETPFDRIWDTMLGIAIIIFATLLVFSLGYEKIISSENFYEELGIYVFIAVFFDMFPAFHLILNPYFAHRKRRKRGLI